MWLWIGKISLLSLLLIFLIHYLYTFFLQNLTTPKVKDLVNRPSEQYENIIRSLKSETPSKKSSVSKAVTSDDNAMKDELKNFLAKEMKTKKETPVFSSMDGGLAPGGGGNLTFSSYT
jgi:hypothetical protein